MAMWISGLIGGVVGGLIGSAIFFVGMQTIIRRQL